MNLGGIQVLPKCEVVVVLTSLEGRSLWASWEK